ncbi:MAG: NAD(P)/FAD-dependent oxidoreductase [Candidatus Eremiobacteraeota bacterium]|nr:NAD(P)/FAD-dependent oxidoreductase [Candidatus Eremiobacteraeota bacterium]
MSKYHTIVVGAGSGGLTVAVGLSKLGKRVALVERRHVGGDCTNYGCIPSKTLIHESRVDPANALSMVRLRRDHLRDEETEWVGKLKRVDFIEGEARFLDPHRMRILGSEERELTAKNVVLATGSRPREITIPGLPADCLLNNETVFELETPPKHLAIVGGGVIGMEMAFCFRRLGSRVSVLDRGERLLKQSEPEVSTLLAKRLEEVGADFYLQTRPERYENGCLVLKDGTRLKAVDKVLVAAGREPNLEMALENAGVEFHHNGIPTDSFGRTNIPHIFAIGDINERSRFTHSANHQGRRLVKKIAFPFLPQGDEPPYPSATFTDPEVAQIGPTLEELGRLYPNEAVKTELVLLKDTDRGYTAGLEHGFVMIHARVLTGKVLSATVVAPSAGEMLSLLTLAVYQGISMYKLADLVFPYPVLSEAVKKAANNFVFSTLGKLPRDTYRYLRTSF